MTAKKYSVESSCKVQSIQQILILYAKVLKESFIYFSIIPLRHLYGLSFSVAINNGFFANTFGINNYCKKR